MWRPQPGEIVAPLHPEVAAYLVQFAKEALRVERAKQTFYAFNAFGLVGLEIQMPSGESVHLAERDIRALAESGYIVAEHFNTNGTFDFYVTDDGLRVAHELEGAPDRFERVEESLLSTLDSDEFRDRHPEAFAAWQSAARLAATDPIGNATKIGHDCREAMQHFGTSMLAKVGVESDLPPDKTVARMRAVLEARRATFGDAEAALLEALLAYWGAAIDLHQRQEHGAQKAGARLSAIDSERVVRHTAIVMFEIDSAIQ